MLHLCKWHSVRLIQWKCTLSLQCTNLFLKILNCIPAKLINVLVYNFNLCFTYWLLQIVSWLSLLHVKFLDRWGYTRFPLIFECSCAISFSMIPQWVCIHCRTSSLLFYSILMLSSIWLMMQSCLVHESAWRIKFLKFVPLSFPLNYESVHLHEGLVPLLQSCGRSFLLLCSVHSLYVLISMFLLGYVI